ncbi:MAG: hypothetical protein AB1384_11225 [Actinomycetota bacterium]
MRGLRNAKSLLAILSCGLFIAAALVLASCSDGAKMEEAPGESSAGADAVQRTEEQPDGEGVVAGEETYPYVDWYDYRYTFLGAWRDRDLNPTSEVVDYGGDYVHLRVRVTMTGDEHPDLKAPLQVLLDCKGREYRIFGKDYSKHSYIWRDYTDFPDGIGESHVYIVTMELMPYSRAFNSSFAMDQAELVLNGIDWTDLQQPQTVPLSRLPLIQLGAAGSTSP